MDFTEVIVQIAVLFLIMFFGYVLRRVHIFSEEGIKSFSSLIFYITMPAMILASITQTSLKSADDLGQTLLASAISYTLFILVAMAVPRLLRVKDGSKGLFRFMTIFGNVGFIGFPMLIAIIDESAVFLGALLNIPFNLLLYTIGVYFIMSDKDANHKLELSIGKFLNPGIIATLAGLVFMILGWELPKVVFDTASTLGRVTTPVAMIVVGASLYGVNLSQLFKNYRVLALSLIRMILFPLCIGLVLRALGMNTMIIAVAMVLGGMPIGTNTVILARQYDGNVLEASEAVFISTFLMLISVPILIFMVKVIA